MQQRWYQCANCGSTISTNDNFCTTCGHSIHWFKLEPQSNTDDPSMHLIPLDQSTLEPIIYQANNNSLYLLPAITTDGRLSWLTATKDITKAIHDRLEYRYPEPDWQAVQSYLCVGVMMKLFTHKDTILIYEVWGFWECFKELDDLYNTLNSLCNYTVGDPGWNYIEKYLSSDPVKSWVNELLVFLKQALDWKNYVYQAINNLYSDA